MQMAKYNLHCTYFELPLLDSEFKIYIRIVDIRGFHKEFFNFYAEPVLLIRSKNEKNPTLSELKENVLSFPILIFDSVFLAKRKKIGKPLYDEVDLVEVVGFRGSPCLVASLSPFENCYWYKIVSFDLSKTEDITYQDSKYLGLYGHNNYDALIIRLFYFWIHILNEDYKLFLKEKPESLLGFRHKLANHQMGYIAREFIDSGRINVETLQTMFKSRLSNHS
jgi:hypothetical protein